MCDIACDGSTLIVVCDNSILFIELTTLSVYKSLATNGWMISSTASVPIPKDPHHSVVSIERTSGVNAPPLLPSKYRFEVEPYFIFFAIARRGNDISRSFFLNTIDLPSLLDIDHTMSKAGDHAMLPKANLGRLVPHPCLPAIIAIDDNQNILMLMNRIQTNFPGLNQSNADFTYIQ